MTSTSSLDRGRGLCCQRHSQYRPVHHGYPLRGVTVPCKAVRMETSADVRFTLTVEDGFNRIRWAPGMRIFGRDVRTAITAVNAISITGKRPLLVHVGFIERVTTAARQLLLEDTCSMRIAILGHDVVSMVITAFAYASATPTRYFTDEAAALEWFSSPTL